MDIMEKGFLKSLDADGIKFIRILWCDNANIIRGKAIHRAALEHHVEHGVGISCAQQSVPAMFDSVITESGLTPVGEVHLIPEWDSFVPIPYAPGHARVMADMVLKGEKWPYCPRQFIKKMIDQAKSEGIEIQASFENEFYLLRADTDAAVPLDTTLFASTYSMDKHCHVINDITEALILQGIPVEQYYPESGPGQHEISVHHTTPLNACDQQIAFRETVRAVAAKHGMKTSFLPKLFQDKAGCGSHLHLSFWWEGENIVTSAKEPYGLTPKTRSFIAGVLNHLPALMAVTAPTTNSYRRIRPQCWTGAYRCWGFDNREAAVRILTDWKTDLPDHIEFKVADVTANPYLAFGAVLAAGLDGVRSGSDLGKPVDIDPDYLSDEERKALSIDRLPSNLKTTLDALEKDSVLTSALGEKLTRAYCAVKRAEYEHMKGFRLEDEVALLMERY